MENTITTTWSSQESWKTWWSYYDHPKKHRHHVVTMTWWLPCFLHCLWYHHGMMVMVFQPGNTGSFYTIFYETKIIRSASFYKALKPEDGTLCLQNFVFTSAPLAFSALHFENRKIITASSTKLFEMHTNTGAIILFLKRECFQIELWGILMERTGNNSVAWNRQKSLKFWI